MPIEIIFNIDVCDKSFSKQIVMPFIPFPGMELRLWVNDLSYDFEVKNLGWIEPDEGENDSLVVLLGEFPRDELLLKDMIQDSKWEGK